MPRRKQQRRRGFVLVMATTLIGVVGLATAGLANRSLSLALEARAGQAQLQKKWASLSCQAELMRDAEKIFGDAAASFEAEQHGWPYPSRLAANCRLGEFRVRLTLADEQAKINLNTLQDRRPEQVAAVLTDASRAAGSMTPLRLRPATDPASVRTKQFFKHWGQVVDVGSLHAENLDGLLAVSTSVTCWGNGRLNITRATDWQLETIARLVLNGPETQRLLESRTGFSGELNDLLQQADVPRRKSAKLRRLLTDRSRCHSLGMTIEHRGRNEFQWAVSEPSRRDTPAVRLYQWP